MAKSKLVLSVVNTNGTPAPSRKRNRAPVIRDMATLIRRSEERRAELSHRSLSPREVRWGTRIALSQVPENQLVTPKWWQLRARMRRFVRMRESNDITYKTSH